jgi:hypothetical protein
VTLDAPPDKVFVRVGLLPTHIEKSGPTLIALKLLMVTVKSIVSPAPPQGLVAVRRIVLAPGTDPAPGTLTVIWLVPAPDEMLKPGGTVQTRVP